MPHDLFGDLVSPSVVVGTKRWYTVPLSVLTHALGVAAVLVAPLLATDVLPHPPRDVVWTTVPPPRTVRPPAPPQVQPVPAVTPAATIVDELAAPIEAPDTLAPEPRRVLPSVPMNAATAPTLPAGAGAVVLRRPPPAPGPPGALPVRVGGDIRSPARIKYVAPEYPAIARTARVAGTVVIEATLARDGTVQGARVVRSVRLLDQAALDAVTQWRYRPTLLNGEPVEVIMNVSVTFQIAP